MIHRPTILVALLVAAVTLAPAARAAAHDDDDAHLMVVADFNRDGIADIAQVLPADGSEPATLKISLGNPGGGFRVLSSAPALDRTPKQSLQPTSTETASPTWSSVMTTAL